jgi:hypothetical protein
VRGPLAVIELGVEEVLPSLGAFFEKKYELFQVCERVTSGGADSRSGFRVPTARDTSVQLHTSTALIMFR